MFAGKPTPTRQSHGSGGTHIGTSSSSEIPLINTQPNYMVEAQLMLPVPAVRETVETNIEGDGNVLGPIIRAGGDIEEDESRSRGSQYQEGGRASGDDQDDAAADRSGQNKRKRYHRHSQKQIKEMEAFFKEWPHPDDEQREELSTRLGLEPLQVKFWFQNKRTQVKAQNGRFDNINLRSENIRLQAEIQSLRESLSNKTCSKCGDPTATGGEMSYDEKQMRLEIARLRDEVERLSSLLAKQARGKAPANCPVLTHPDSDLGFQNTAFGLQQPAGTGAEMYVHRSVSRTPAEEIKHMTVHLAAVAMEEIMAMAQVGEPMWVPCSIDSTSSMLREEEYIGTFPIILAPKPEGFKSEGSRKMAVVRMDHLNLVEILMDVKKWSTVFSSIVSRATALDVLSTGVAGTFNGTVQVMSAEFQFPSPLVPTRESYFARYCKLHPDGTWAVVDLSLDDISPSPAMRSQKRPSGCLIQEMPDGYSKVTWIENVEVDDSGVHDMYKPVLSAGLGFGAKRWVATLDRQCERLANALATNVCTNDIVMSTPEGRKNMLKLTERMLISFTEGISRSVAHGWATMSGNSSENVRIMTRKSMDDPGRPTGIMLSAATSFWLPVSPKMVFDFLCTENSRNEWDILSDAGIAHELSHIPSGPETGNCVSLLQVNRVNSSQNTMLILQESFLDPTASFVVYSPVDVQSMQAVLSGGNPDYVALLPSGFSILPDGLTTLQREKQGFEVSSDGSLLTMGLQILVNSMPTEKLSVASVTTVNNLVVCTVDRIKDAINLRRSNARGISKCMSVVN